MPVRGFGFQPNAAALFEHERKLRYPNGHGTTSRGTAGTTHPADSVGTSKIIVNASHLGGRVNGIGAYILQLLRHWATMPCGLRFEVYLHESARPRFDGFAFPENFSLNWIGSRRFRDTDNLRRFIFSNMLAARRMKHVIFNASQLEMTFYGARQVVTVHDLIPLVVDGHYQRKQYYYFRFALPLGLARAMAIITPSQSTRKELLARFQLDPAKVVVIAHGVRLFPARGNGSKPGRGRKYILFAGRIVPYRNIDRLVQAFLAIQHLVEHDLVLAGEVFHELRLPAGNSRIISLGYVSDEELRALYEGASAFVFPSLAEGFGMTPSEAMALGCPVVASREASLPEVCGSAALLVDPWSVASIAEGMARVLLDERLRETLSREGVKRAMELSWEKSAREHLRIFAQVGGHC